MIVEISLGTMAGTIATAFVPRRGWGRQLAEVLLPPLRPRPVGAGSPPIARV
jgi:hypothetical protein